MRVLVTGDTGFLASHLIPKLEEWGADIIKPPYRSMRYDLRDPMAAFACFRDAGKIDVLFHLAANVGGIGYNIKHPATLLRDNALMTINVLHQAIKHNVGKVVMVGSTCAYPRDCPIPFKESDLFNGYPEETNAPYAEAKRLALVYLQALGKESGLKWAYAIPTNLYGERDFFGQERSHVIPALIKKCMQNDTLEVWGTGKATRDFLYAGDCADGLLAIAEAEGIFNLGSGRETPIRELVSIVMEATEFVGDVGWDPSKPDGQPRRLLDITRAQEIGWEPKVSLEEGIIKTVAWYKGAKK